MHHSNIRDVYTPLANRFQRRTCAILKRALTYREQSRLSGRSGRAESSRSHRAANVCFRVLRSARLPCRLRGLRRKEKRPLSTIWLPPRFGSSESVSAIESLVTIAPLLRLMRRRRLMPYKYLRGSRFPSELSFSSASRLATGTRERSVMKLLLV